MIIAIDAGNNETKVMTKEGVFKFCSTLGEWRDRRVKSDFGDSDMEYEYNGKKGFAGTLAKFESEFKRERMGMTKAHEDAKLRVLLALHRYGDNAQHFDIIVGQPIERHTEEEKESIKDMLTGSHTITVNGDTRSFEIRQVNVAPEGAGAYWATNAEDRVARVLDIGSGTVNGATIYENRYLDKDSFTEPYGANSTKSKDMEQLAEAVAARALQKWEKNDIIYLVGGLAEQVDQYINKHFSDVTVVRPSVRVESGFKTMHPVYANVVGFYKLAKAIYNG